MLGIVPIQRKKEERKKGKVYRKGKDEGEEGGYPESCICPVLLIYSASIIRISNTEVSRRDPVST